MSLIKDIGAVVAKFNAQAALLYKRNAITGH
jgi:hypothetical protein